MKLKRRDFLKLSSAVVIAPVGVLTLELIPDYHTHDLSRAYKAKSKAKPC